MKSKLTHLLTMAATGLLIVSCSATGSSSTLSKVTPYPLKTCVVTDNTLGSMGDPVTKIHNGQEMKFCCKPCVKKFDANPDKYLAKLAR